MKISCIITTRDRCDMVLQAIASATAQKGGSPEIVVVDDGSVDGTQKHIKKNYPAAKLIRLSGLGPGPARNAGVAAADGDVLMFLDSDDIWLVDHLDVLRNTLSKGFQVAYGTTTNIDKINGGNFLIPDNGQGPGGNIFSQLLRWCFLVPSSFAVHRRAFDQTDGFPTGDLADDWAFFLHLARRHHFGFAGPEPITLRYLHEGSQCAIHNHEAVLTTLRRMAEDLDDESIHAASIHCRINELEKWTIDQQQEWATVQEWYCDLKKDGMV